ncbi:DUF2163 domain-containing protein [Stakelama saccharophila]|uniref:DUF2163 domain-containing protein n=1 Tax=Stakelama saccharophila TaxID=3075605 RepID=A0ABZ0B8B8_9SPHN|nr:DUF2163 domain-containing protein [Stakelama sp. W311]WNO53539.1 DUF2163 domain-containing protein [Stakelama sp. W311]
MADWLQGALTTMTLCWRLDRRDGVTIGLTAHDRDLERNGLVYRAAPGMTPSAIKRGAGLDVDTMDVTGALDHGAIDAADLRAGRWDGARVTLFAVDWERPDTPIELGRGTIGDVETTDTAFTAELRGVTAALERAAVEETAPACRAALGDGRCRVAMAGRRRMARVVTAENVVLTLDREEPIGNAYGFGMLAWFSGPNSGLRAAIAASDGATVTLRRPPRFETVGALVEITEGCDKQLATCAERFGNAVNFRGEPYLPGIDLLTRYPGA